MGTGEGCLYDGMDMIQNANFGGKMDERGGVPKRRSKGISVLFSEISV